MNIRSIIGFLFLIAGLVLSIVENQLAGLLLLSQALTFFTLSLIYDQEVRKLKTLIIEKRRSKQ